MINFIRRSFIGASFFTVILLGVFWTLYVSGLAEKPEWYEFVLPPVFILATCMMLAFLNDRFSLFPERTYWIMICYAGITCCFPRVYSSPGAFSSAFLISLALFSLVYSAFVSATRVGPFMTAFFITCAGLIHFPAFFMFVPFLISFLRLAKVSPKDIVAFAGGIAAPLTLASFVVWFRGHDPWQYLLGIVNHFSEWSFSVAINEYPVTEIVLVSFIAFLVLFAFYRLLLHAEATTTVITSRFYETLFWILLCSLVVFAGYPAYRSSFIPVILLPVSIMLTSLFVDRKSFWAHVLLFCLYLLLAGHYVLSNYFPELLGE